MPGFRHSPLADIQRIRQDLRDRYRGGFPILKELLQNADDAGADNSEAAATQCLILLSQDGLSGAQHTLLRGPGLCVLNDGDFLPGDANSITSLGLSNKATQSGTAGKFGLGLKSVFHWAEALFYFSPHTFPGDPAKQSPASDLMNPWWSRYAEDGLHAQWDEEWNQTRATDIQAFAALAALCLQTSRWFGLWIPFRRASHLAGVEPIEKTEPKADLNELFGEGWIESLGCTLPLLRHVRSVRAGEMKAGRLSTTCLARSHEANKRMRFGTCRLQDLPTGRQSLSGKVSLTIGASQPATLSFSGHEHIPETLAPETWLNHQYWPSQSSIGSSGQMLQEKEKAAIHGAALFVRSPAASPASLQVQHAVFLPLGQAELIKCSGPHNYNLYLHGFFFVDSGRQHIQDFTDVPPDADLKTVTTETDLLRLWNRNLMRDIVAPMVLPSLEAFVRQEQMSPAESEWLVGALAHAKPIQKLMPWMCREQRFILRLLQNGCAWERQTWTATAPPWLQLPAPDFPHKDLFSIMPALANLSTQVAVSLDAAPCLADHKQRPVAPGDEELAQLLGSVPVLAFSDPKHLAFLLKLIPQDAAGRKSDSPFAVTLARLANRLIHDQLPTDEPLANLWRQFFKRIPSAAFVGLPFKSTEAASEISQVLTDASLPVALLWQDFRDAPGNGSIDWPAALRVFKALGGLLLKAEDACNQRSRIAVRLLEASTDKPPDWTTQISHLPLFAAHEPSKAALAVSLEDLQALSASGRLFSGGEPCAKDLAKAAPELKPLLLQPPVAEMLGLQAPECGPATCVAVLRNLARLAADFSGRKPLFDRLLREATSDDADCWSALRCLLHGDIKAWETPVALYDETGAAPVLLRLIQKALGVANQPWRCIAARLVGQLALTAQQRQHLNLVPSSEVNVESLIRDAGPSNLDCSDFSTEECDYILERFNDVEVLRRLNIHETLDRSRVRIGPHTYVDDGTFNELPAMCRVTRLRDRPGYARFRNSDGFRPLSWEAVIELELDQPNPVQEWRVILTAIGRLGTLRKDLRDRVRQVAWLPLPNGSAVKPSQLLDLPGAEPEIDRLPAEVLSDHLPLLRLAEPVRHHDRFGTLQHAVLPSAREVLDTLAELLHPHPAWSTGLSGQWTSEQVDDWVLALGTLVRQNLHLAPLLNALYLQKQLREHLPIFLNHLAGTFSANQYATILQQLAAGHENAALEKRPVFERVTVRYLETIGLAGTEFLLSVLSSNGLTLLSAGGTWQAPAKLTLVRNGVHPESVVASNLEPALGCLRTARDAARLQRSRLSFPYPGELPQRSAASARLLREYFEPWRDYLPSSDPIGFLLSVMGGEPQMLATAQQFLSVHTAEGIRQWVDQHETSQGPRFSYRINRWTFLVDKIDQGDTLTVPSLLGPTFRARRSTKISSIFVGDGHEALEIFRPEAGRAVCEGRLLDFRRELENSSPEDLLAVLEGSMQIVLRFLDAHVDLGPLWETAKKATQLHVRVAQGMVLDGAIAFLQQVGAQRNQQIRQALALWHEAQRLEAEEEVQGFAADRSEQRRRKARRVLRDLLSADQKVQAATLAAVRDKIDELGYVPSSVPFELWQNADDAITQLERLSRDPTDAVALGFVVVQSQTDLLFCHWGRLINEFQSPGGHNCRDDGFDRDMVNMLAPAISDKRDLAQRGGPAVTGKFGLGFKSVFLVSDVPQILSGNVDFVARGGIYPDRLSDQEKEHLRRELEALAPNQVRRGTIIRLTLRADLPGTAEQILDLFLTLGPLLVLFSRKLKRLRFRLPKGPEREIQWQPRTLAEGVEVGGLQQFDGNGGTAMLLSRTIDNDRLQFLLGLNPDGFVPLPSEVPAFWVTAPTGTTPGYGFAVNGPFEPDVGRVQLALNSARNEGLAAELSRFLPTLLQTVGQQAEKDWKALKDSLRLASRLSHYDFWQTLWEVLAQRFADRCPKSDMSTVAKLARRILWNSDTDGLRALYHNANVLPVGLWGDYRALTRLPYLRYSAVGALDRQPIFELVSRWPAFRRAVPVGQICSNTQVASTLERLGVRLNAVQPVHLANALEWEFGEGCRADPEIAARLGLLITSAFLMTLREGKAVERNEQDHSALVELLAAVHFQAADGSWHKATHLVVAHGEDVQADEMLRAAFAPRDCRLNKAYIEPALEFFLASRPRLEADVETMTTWILQANVEDAQVAALRYLLKGELKERLAEALRRQRDDNNWLWQLQSTPWFERRFPDEDDRFELLSHCLRLFEDQFREWAQAQRQPEETQPEPEQERPVWTVQQLWLWWQGLGEPAADYTLEGEANWRLFHGGALRGEQERKAELKRLLLSPGDASGKELWYRLFAYACLVSAGRTMTELRDFWMNQLTPAHFWEKTSEGDFSERTKGIFEKAVTAKFTDMAAGGEQAYFWRRIFYDVRKVHRMVCNDFPAVLLDLVSQGHGEHLRQFLRTGHLPGPGQQRWIGTFGQSADTPLGFIIRELVRLEVITDDAVRPYAFYVCRPVLRALLKIRWIGDDDYGFSGETWLQMLQDDPDHGRLLLRCYDIPLLHMGVSYRGDRFPTPPTCPP